MPRKIKALLEAQGRGLVKNMTGLSDEQLDKHGGKECTIK